MIILYLKDSDLFLQAIKGSPETKEEDNRLYISVNGVWKVALNDLTIAGYKEYPDQEVNVPIDEEGNPLPVTVAELNLRDFIVNDLPTSMHLAIVKSIDPSKPKPAVVTREYMGKQFDIPCVVTESMKDQWLAGDIRIGDVVIVAYCQERLDDAIIIAKVFKSW